MLEALLQAIQADPDSVELRLVLADWLDDHDDLRGTWLRQQCDLAIWRPNPLERERLRQHEQTTYRQLLANWLDPFPHSTRFLRARLGLLEVWMDANPLRQNPIPSKIEPWIESLRLFGTFDEILPLLVPPLTQSLHALDLRQLQIKNQELIILCRHIDTLGDDWQIRRLDLRGNLLEANAWDILTQTRSLHAMHQIRLDDSVVNLQRDRNANPWMRMETPTPAGQTPMIVVNSIGMHFIQIPAGRFVMGSPIHEHEHEADETIHPVHHTRPFFMGETPVTQHAYHAITSEYPSRFHNTLDPESRPVEMVSWNQAVDFCHRLGQLPQEQAAGRSYRLPTEAEWEYACRAGTQTRYAFGDSLSHLHANFGSEIGTTTPVGVYPANAFGLYDMHGNVREWCRDLYSSRYYHEGPTEDPPGPVEGGSPVLRGGAWEVAAGYCRSAYRVYHSAASSLAGIGFRVVCEIKPT